MYQNTLKYGRILEASKGRPGGEPSALPDSGISAMAPYQEIFFQRGASIFTFERSRRRRGGRGQKIHRSLVDILSACQCDDVLEIPDDDPSAEYPFQMTEEELNSRIKKNTVHFPSGQSILMMMTKIAGISGGRHIIGWSVSLHMGETDMGKRVYQNVEN